MKRIVSILICVTMLLSVFSLGAFAAENKDYIIVSLYDEVIWEGDGAWGAYKGTLHSHTTYSDADVDLATMVKGYYEQDYDFLANADHGVTGVAWNRAPVQQFLYNYSTAPRVHLTDEEFEGITTGTYPLADGTIRNKKMVCVEGANELNNLTLTKAHVNGYFLPEGVGDGYGGKESGYEQALQFIEDNGGISHINHPGDWLESNKDINTVSDSENVKFFADLILKFDSCYGMEVFNENNGTTGFDRILWDNILMYSLPYGKNVWGYSNTDAHNIENIDTSFSVFMMQENTVENIKYTMMNGAFFSVSRRIPQNDIIGPAEEIDVCDMRLPYPVFTSVKTDGHKITVTADNCDRIQWIANGKVIASGEIGDKPVTLDLDAIEGAEAFMYVRAEVIGEGGMCLTQALVIDDGSEPLEFKEDTGFKAFLDDLWFAIKSTRLGTIVIEVARIIKYS